MNTIDVSGYGEFNTKSLSGLSFLVTRSVLWLVFSPDNDADNARDSLCAIVNQLKKEKKQEELETVAKSFISNFVNAYADVSYDESISNRAVAVLEQVPGSVNYLSEYVKKRLDKRHHNFIGELAYKLDPKAASKCFEKLAELAKDDNQKYYVANMMFIGKDPKCVLIYNDLARQHADESPVSPESCIKSIVQAIRYSHYTKYKDPALAKYKDTALALLSEFAMSERIGEGLKNTAIYGLRILMKKKIFSEEEVNEELKRASHPLISRGYTFGVSCGWDRNRRDLYFCGHCFLHRPQ